MQHNQLDMATFLGIAVAAATIVPMIQSRDQYADEVRRVVRFRRAEAAQRLRHHQETLRLRDDLFTKESEHTVAQDMQRYRIRLALSRRQAFRDAGIQHVLLNQTVSMVAGLMLGCAFCLIGQGVLPDPNVQADNRALVMIFATAAGIAIGCLAAAVWCSVKIQNRMTYYDHSCGRGEGTLLQSTSASRAELSSLRHAPTATFAQKHATPQLYFGCRRAHRSLQDYLQCHTEGLRTWATLLLQIGSLAVLVAGWAFAGMTLFIQDNASRWLLLVLLAVAIISIIGGDRLFPDETRRDGDAGMMGDGIDGSDPLQEIGMERCLDELLEQEAAQRAQELAVQ